MNIYDITGTLLKTVQLKEEAVHERELMKSNFIRLSWNDRSLYRLPVGAYIVHEGVRYMLLDPYTPSKARHLEFNYSPEFQHPTMWPGRLPYYVRQGETKKYDFVASNFPSTLAQHVVDIINEYNIPDLGNDWTLVYSSDLGVAGTCSFPSVDILSALTEICNVFKCQYNLDFESHTLRLGNFSEWVDGTHLGFSLADEPAGYVPVELKSGENLGVATKTESKEEYHNAYYVQGSNKNQAKVSDNGDLVQVTERLTLDENEYPDSTIYLDENGEEIMPTEEKTAKEIFEESGLPLLAKSLV